MSGLNKTGEIDHVCRGSSSVLQGGTGGRKAAMQSPSAITSPQARRVQGKASNIRRSAAAIISAGSRRSQSKRDRRRMETTRQTTDQTDDETGKRERQGSAAQATATSAK